VSSFSGQVSQGSDDARQNSAGTVVTNATVDTIKDTGSPTTSAVYWGCRFQDVTLPATATVSAANLSLYVPAGTPAMDAKIYGNAAANPATFSTGTLLSSYTSTTHSVTWNTSLTAAQFNNSPDVTNVVDDLLGLSGWGSGNAMMFVLQAQSSTSGCQVENYDGSPSEAAELSITYSAVTTPGVPTAIVIAHDATNPNSALDVSWTAPSSNGGASISDYKLQYTTDGLTINTVDLGSTSTSYTFSGLTMGQLYGVQIAAVNSVGTGGYSGEWTYGTPAGTVYAVSETTDEVFQNTSGTVTDGITPGISISANEYIAWRFQSIAAVQGAVPAKAYLILSSELGTTVAGTAWCEAADNAATFTTSTNSVTALAQTTHSDSFGTIGTGWTAVNVSAPVQDVFNRSGWATGHALAFILECTSGSTAIYSYANGGPTQPMLLLVTGSSVSASPNVPLDSLARLAASPALPLDARASVAASDALPLETRCSLASAPSLPLDAKQGLAGSDALPIEPLAALDLATALPLDSAGSLAASKTLPLDTLGRFAASAVPPIDWSQATVTLTPLLPLDWLGRLAGVPLLPLDFGQTAVGIVGSAALPLEFLLTAANNQTATNLPIEWTGVGTRQLQIVAPIEWRATLAAIAKILPLDTTLSVALKPVSPLEWAGTATSLSVAPLLPLDWRAQLGLAPALPLHSRTSLTGSPAIPLEVLAAALSAPLLPLDLRASLAGRPVGPLEWSGRLLVASGQPINWLAPLAVSHGLPIETRLSLALVPFLPLEWSARFVRTSALPLEALGSFADRLLLPLETRAQLVGTRTLPVESRLAVGQAASLPLESLGGLRTLFGLPVEVKASLQAKPPAPLEWLGSGSIVAADRMPIEWRAALAGLVALPIEPKASIASSPTLDLGPWTLNLSASPTLPIRWYQNLPPVVPTLPLELLRGLVSAGATLPVEWFADAQPDYSGGVFKLPKRGRVFCLDARGTVFVLGPRGTVFKIG
jgi:Fibronectin type III domain